MRVGCEVLSVGDYDKLNTVEDFAKYLHEYKSQNLPCVLTYRLADVDLRSTRSSALQSSQSKSQPPPPPPYTPNRASAGASSHKNRVISTVSSASHRSALQRAVFTPDRSYSKSDGARVSTNSHNKFSKVI
jgi:hypothetical protein